MIKFAPNISAEKPAEAKPFTMVMGQNERMAGSVPVFDSGKSFAENLAEAGDFGISDLVDIINPLQHIPVVSNFYQSLTGDTMGAMAEIIGGAVFGGPLGALAGVGATIYKSAKENYTDGNAALYDVSQSVSVSPADNRPGYKPYNA